MPIPHCEFCGGPVRLPEGRCLPVYPTAFSADPDTVWYCSAACEARDDSDWAPTLCEGCLREIRLRREELDTRDARALQLTTDASGNPICRRCAGLAADESLPPDGLSYTWPSQA